MASIISELRSVTFQSKSTTVFVSKINIRKDNRMAPQQHDTLPKSSDFEVQQSEKSSPVSNIGTSIESSPPLSSIEDAPESINQQKEAKIEEPSSDDSGSVQNYQVNQEEFQSPLMRLQSALKKDGRLGKKICLSSSLPKGNAENNWLPSPVAIFERHLPTTSNGYFERNLPTTASGTIDRNSPSTSSEVYHNNLSSTASYHSSLPSTATRMYDSSLLSTSSGIYDSNLPSSSAGTYNGGIPSVNTGIYHGSLQSTSKGMYHNSLPSTSSTVYDTSTFSCRVCDFTCVLKEEYDMHMNLHYNHKCPHCNYTSRTEGRLKRHVKEFHSDTPPESWAGSRASRKEISSEQSIDNSVTSSNGKARAFRCKHCDFVAYQKADFWKHSKVHIKPDKLLQCPHCDFVTEFKHHYEYHLANHFGRKPFKCSMCNYKCVNKSMLNSHLKSHSSVYQFHCADCKYETKYCHSIKQHLKKQNHKPGIVLNHDGSPCPFQIIDVYGRRRGPRTKKRKLSDNIENNCSTSPVPSANHQPSILPNSPQGMTFSTAVPMLQPNIPTLYPSFFGDYPQSLIMRTNPQMNSSSFSMPLTISGRNHNNCFRCAICPFITDDQDILKRHTVLHIASENQDIAKLYGFNSEFFREQEIALNGDMSKQKHCEEPEECDKTPFLPTADNISKSHQTSQDYKQEHDEILLETHNVKSEEGSSPKYRRISSPKNDDENDSFREYSSPSPPGSSSYSPDLVSYMKKFVDNRTSPNFLKKENRMEDNESPIDLSGRKSSDSIKTDKASEDAVKVKSMEQKRFPSIPGMDSSNVSSSSQRNRRKGKAYRINHYMQYDEQSAHQEFSKEDSNHNCIDSCENSMEDNKDSTKGQSESALRVPPVFPVRQQNVNFPTSYSESSGCSNPQQESRSPSNPCEDPRVNSNGVNGQCPTSSSDKNVERVKDTNSSIENTMLEPTSKSQTMDMKQSRVNPNGINGQCPTSSSDKNVEKVEGTNSSIENTMLKPTSKSQTMDMKQSRLNNSNQSDAYECAHCEIVFKNCTMYSLHKGYHGFKDPFTCNFCGHVTKTAMEFFIHIARASHA